MSLRTEFLDAVAQMPKHLTPEGFRVNRFLFGIAASLHATVNDVATRVRGGESFTLSAERTLNPAIIFPRTGRRQDGDLNPADDIMKLPAFSQLLAAAAAPDTDIALCFQIKYLYERGYELTVTIDPTKPFHHSVVKGHMFRDPPVLEIGKTDAWRNTQLSKPAYAPVPAKLKSPE